VGRFRYFLESFVRKCVNIEGELDGKPFNDNAQSFIKGRKNVKQTISFGMQDDPNRIGYEWLRILFIQKSRQTIFRTTVGNSQCLQTVQYL
jgi:hypothetical protein